LNAKVTGGKGDYQPLPTDVNRHQIPSDESVVGFYVYPAKHNPRQVVIFCHGNIRSSLFLSKFCEQLSNGRERAVVARDFVGYDLSSPVPSHHDGALEIAAIANDLAVYKWVVDKYPDAEIIVGGRSIGTLGWVNLVPQDKVKKTFGFVPLADVAGPVTSVVVNKFASRIPPLLVALCRPLLRFVIGPLLCLIYVKPLCNKAFPTYSDGTIQTFGFSAAKTLKSYVPKVGRGKALLFEARNDKLVPHSHVEILAKKLQRLSIDTRVITMDGDHDALPYYDTNPAAATELEAFLSSS
jgi:pimeloyl-ACP methyl ester carboxylesterase